MHDLSWKSVPLDGEIESHTGLFGRKQLNEKYLLVLKQAPCMLQILDHSGGHVLSKVLIKEDPCIPSISLATEYFATHDGIFHIPSGGKQVFVLPPGSKNIFTHSTSYICYLSLGDTTTAYLNLWNKAKSALTKQISFPKGFAPISILVLMDRIVIVVMGSRLKKLAVDLFAVDIKTGQLRTRTASIESSVDDGKMFGFSTTSLLHSSCVYQ